MPGLLGRLFGRRTRIDPAEEERQRRSWAELKAGRLPLSAQERLASQLDDEVFTSDLSTRDVAGIRSAGYEAVGQVFGTSTVAVNRTQAFLSSPPPGRYQGYSRPNSYWAPWPIKGYFTGELQSRERALRRMQAEARELGAEGVIGVRPVRSTITSGLYEYTVVGTAIRQRGTTAVGVPFLAAVDGADFGALVRTGWLPATIIAAMVRWSVPFNPTTAAGPGVTARLGLNPLAYVTSELSTMSGGQLKAQSEVRARLDQQVRAARADGMLMHGWDTRWEREEGRYNVEVDAWGTAIVRSTRPVRSAAEGLQILPVVRLDEGDE